MSRVLDILQFQRIREKAIELKIHARSEETKAWLWAESEARMRFGLGFALGAGASLALGFIRSKDILNLLAIGSGLVCGFMVKRQHRWFCLGVIVGSLDLILAGRSWQLLAFLLGIGKAALTKPYALRALKKAEELPVIRLLKFGPPELFYERVTGPDRKEKWRDWRFPRD